MIASKLNQTPIKQMDEYSKMNNRAITFYTKPKLNGMTLISIRERYSRD